MSPTPAFQSQPLRQTQSDKAIVGHVLVRNEESSNKASMEPELALLKSTGIYNRGDHGGSGLLSAPTAAGSAKKAAIATARPPISSSPRLTLNWAFLESDELFGRQRETKLLQEALHRRIHAANAKPELILISGGSGTGKTALAKSVRTSVEKAGGFFVMGKFDQLKRPEPYAPLVAAMTAFLVLVPNRGPAVAEATTQSILKALEEESAADISVLTYILPVLQEILGPNHKHDNTSCLPTSTCRICSSSCQSKASLQTSTKDPERRQKAIFSKFVRACCSIQHPLVLVMDDLQWADSGCLELLETIASDSLCDGLALVGICRSNEVTMSHDFAVVLRRLEDERNTCITNIDVGSLSLDATNALVSTVLLSSKEKCQFVANTVHAKTDGNALFIMELLKALYEAGVLVSDPDTQWLWDDNVWTGGLKGTTDVVDLVIRQIERLPQVCRLLLSTSACFGAELDEFLLLRSMDDESSQRVQEALNQCVSEGMIVKEPDANRYHYRFFHDRIQQASYSLIPEKERPLFHLVLGRKFMQTLTDFELAGYIFLVVDQMIRGVEHITEEDEKVEVAALCLQAGQKAVLSSDFRTALKYFELGESLLDQRRKWVDHYHLVLNVYNAKAETYCCIADFENMEESVASIFMNARSFGDKLRGYQLRIFSLGSLGSLREAILLGLEVLEHLGEPNVSKRLGMCNLIAKLLNVKRMLWKKTDADLLRLPDISDPIKLSAMEILNMLFTFCYISDQQLFPFIALRMVKVSLKYGVSAISTAAFASYGILLCAIGDYDGANRFGQLSISLLERRYQSVRREWFPRCYIIHYGLIAHWKQASRSTFKYLERAHQVGLESGDIEYAWISHFLYGTHCFIVGDPLVALEAVYRDAIQQMRNYKQEVWAELTLINHEAALMLMGRQDDPIVVKGALKNLGKDSKKLKEVQNVANMNLDLYFCQACTQSMIAHYYLGELERALAMAKGSENAAVVVPAAQLVPSQAFYDGLTAVTILRQNRQSLSFLSRRKLLSRTKRALKMHRKYAKHCQENFFPRVVLLEAELAAWRGNLDLALAKYALAEELACRGEHFGMQGLAAERVGLTLRQFGHGESVVVKHLERSIVAYTKWGAWAVVARVKTLLVVDE